MSIQLIKEQLVDAGLHEESTERLLEAYQDMRFYLGSEDYVAAGAYVGNFCENLANIILKEAGEGANPHIQVGNFVDNIQANNYDTGDLDYELCVTIPRVMRVAYDLRNNRVSVHVNLEVPVNHTDTQTAVRLCTWMLTDLLRIYGDEDDIDEIAGLVEELAAPLTPYIDSYNGKRIIMSRELDVDEEILVHLYAIGREVDADTLTEWVPGADGHKVKSTLGRLKQAREARYDSATAKITPLGIERAEEIIDEHLDGIDSLSRRHEQQVES